MRPLGLATVAMAPITRTWVNSPNGTTLGNLGLISLAVLLVASSCTSDAPSTGSPRGPAGVLDDEAFSQTLTDAREIEDALVECMKDRGFEYERIVANDQAHPELLSLVGTALWADELTEEYALGVATLAIPAELLSERAIGSPLRIGHSFDARMLPGEERSLAYWEEYDVALHGEVPPPGVESEAGSQGCLALVASAVSLDLPEPDSDLAVVSPPRASAEERDAAIQLCMRDAGLVWDGFGDYRDSVMAMTTKFAFGRGDDGGFFLDPDDESTLVDLQQQEFLIARELARCSQA